MDTIQHVAETTDAKHETEGSEISIRAFLVLKTDGQEPLEHEFIVKRNVSSPVHKEGFEWSLSYESEHSDRRHYEVRFDKFKREDDVLANHLSWDAQGMWFICSFRTDSVDGTDKVVTEAFLYIYEEQLSIFEDFIGLVSYDDTPPLTQEGDEEAKIIIFKKSQTMLPGQSTTPSIGAPGKNTTTTQWFWTSIHQLDADPFFQWWSLKIDSSDRKIVVFKPHNPHISSDVHVVRIWYDVDNKYMAETVLDSDVTADVVVQCIVCLPQQYDFEVFVSSVYDRNNQVNKTEQSVLLRRLLKIREYSAEMYCMSTKYNIIPKILAIPLVYLLNDGHINLVDVYEHKNELRVAKAKLDLPALGIEAGFSKFHHMQQNYRFYTPCTLPTYYSTPDDKWLDDQHDFFSTLKCEDFISIWTYNFRGDRFVNPWLHGHRPRYMDGKDRNFLMGKSLTSRSHFQYLLFEPQIRKIMGYEMNIHDLHAVIKKWSWKQWEPVMRDWVQHMLDIFKRVPRTNRPITLFRGETAKHETGMSMFVERDQVHTFKSFSMCPTVAALFAGPGGSINVTTFPAGYPLLITAGLNIPGNICECECLCSPGLVIENRRDITDSLALRFGYLSSNGHNHRKIYQVTVQENTFNSRNAMHLKSIMTTARRMYNLPMSRK